MDPRNIWHWILLIIGIYIIVHLALLLLGVVLRLAGIAIVLAVIVAVVYVLYNLLFARKRSY